MAVNTVTHQVYVANSAGTVTVIDGATESTTTLQVGGSPSAVAVNEVTNQIYVANATSNGVTVINGATNALTTVSDPNAKGPSLVAVNEATNQIYVVNAGSLNVTVIDGASNATTTVAEVSGSSPVGVAINSATNQIYIANPLYSKCTPHHPECMTNCIDGVVTVIDGASNAVMNVDVGPCPQGIAVNPVTNKVFVPLGEHAAVIDGATNAVTTVAVPAYGLAVNSTTDKIYAVSGSNVTQVIDGATLSTTAVFAAITTPQGVVAVDAATNTVYVTNVAYPTDCPGPFCNPGSVTVIDGATNATTTLIDPHASGPAALAIDASADRIYVANTLSNNLTVIAGNSAPTSHALAVVFSGAPGGTVASSPAGIDCGVSSCAASFPVGAMVNLSATGSAPNVFGGWSGACSGSGACHVTMNSDQFVTATFEVGVAVPNVVGTTQSAATSAITGAKLSMGTVTQQSSSTVASGDVIGEMPAAGSYVAPGSAVNLVVSSGSPDGGGGGAFDWLTVGALLGSLSLGLRRSNAGAIPYRPIMRAALIRLATPTVSSSVST